MTFIRHLSDIELSRRIDSLRSLFPVNHKLTLCWLQATSTLRTVVKRTKAIETMLVATLVMLVLAHRVLRMSIFLTWWATLVIQLSSPNNLRCKPTLCKWWCSSSSSKQLIRWWCSSLWTQWWLRCSKRWLSVYKCSSKWRNNSSLSSSHSNLLLRNPILMMLLVV